MRKVYFLTYFTLLSNLRITYGLVPSRLSCRDTRVRNDRRAWGAGKEEKKKKRHFPFPSFPSFPARISCALPSLMFTRRRWLETSQNISSLKLKASVISSAWVFTFHISKHLNFRRKILSCVSLFRCLDEATSDISLNISDISLNILPSSFFTAVFLPQR